MRLPIASLAALGTTLALSASAMSGSSTRHAATARANPPVLASMRYGRSVGSPTDGHLVGGTHLDETGYLRVVPADAAGDVRWGVGPLVDMIDRSARSVRRQFPDAITSVGHLSREGGGDIDQHRSHESGRDADVGFFIRASGGKELLASHFVAFRGDGTAPTWPGAYFDDARNWTLVSSMIGDPEAHVTHVFVAAPLRARLLSYAERVGAPTAVRVHAAEVMQQPRGALPHDDHFHIRIGCPSHMRGCIENPAAPNAHPRRLELMAHGRRGGPARTVVATATATSTTPSSATPTPTVTHDRTPDPADNAAPSTDPVEPALAPEAPPASIAVPVDDVDG
jgi:penicillin-insensitive murein endopeptidase